MTEADWLTSDNLGSLWWYIRYRSNKRKSRLYTVGCCRQVWRLFVDPACRRAVEVSERYADGLCGRDELIRARSDLQTSAAVDPAWLAVCGVSQDAAAWVFAAAVRTAFNRPDPNDVGRHLQKAAADAPDLPERQRLLFRDLAGPRLFRPTPVDRSLLAWNDGALSKMARLVYDDRAFDRLPLLADALEDAGCTDAAILTHCRHSGEHARGCWVVDLLLGKA